MFSFELPILALSLALTASASPTPQPEHEISARAPVSGTNTGTIFMFGSDDAARTTLYNSGSCGLSTYFASSVKPTDHLVAFPSVVMAKYGASQHNTLCGKVAHLSSGGKNIDVVVADTNVSPENSIDMTSTVWEFFGKKDGDGSHAGFEIQWSIDM